MTTRHLVCHCPFFDSERYHGDQAMRTVPWEHVPEAVLAGVAPAMHADLAQTYWGSQLPRTTRREGRKLLGAEDGKLTKHGSTDLELQRHSQLGLNARQVYHRIQDTTYSMETPNFPREVIHNAAPDQITAYTDGSFTNPKA